MNNFTLQRGWADHPVLTSNEPYSRALAWVWLIENACWKDRQVRVMGQTIWLKRGQLSHSERFMADKWNRTQAWVHRFLASLKSESMIASDDASGQNVITLCNYDKYQLRPRNYESVSET
jgi:hypothetical protein